MNKKIGIIGTLKADDVFGVSGNYLNWIRIFSEIPVIIPPCSMDEFSALKLDAVVLPGGADVNPKRYSKFPSFFTGRSDPFLEWFDEEILPNIIGVMPIFGICRGLQTLNVLFGGTLKQHLFTHPYSEHDEDLVHKVVIQGKEKGTFAVNSMHHQSIDKLAEPFISTLLSEDGKVIEGILAREYKMAAVQYHPERIRDQYAIKLFEALLKM